MNIFVLDLDPKKAAQAHCDKHVNKMITEHMQMMSVALDFYGLEPARKKNGEFYSVRAYKNHPCTIWVRESMDNFEWIYALTWHLCQEFRSRYDKQHAGEVSLLSIDQQAVKKTFPHLGHTMPAQAMPDFCKIPGNPVQAYRNYYNYLKWEFAVWNKSTPAPSWWAPQCLLYAKNEY